MGTDENRTRERERGLEAPPDLHLVSQSEPEQAPQVTWSGFDRRQSGDRRERPTRPWDSLLGFRNRRRGRRLGESQNAYVDVFTRADIALMLGVFVLNILDAFFTLRWLRMGGGEGNPLMDALIRSDEVIFLVQKCLVVGLWLIVLVIHRNFRIARYGLWGALILYGAILFYHFFLQAGGPPLSVSPQIILDPIESFEPLRQ